MEFFLCRFNFLACEFAGFFYFGRLKAKQISNGNFILIFELKFIFDLFLPLFFLFLLQFFVFLFLTITEVFNDLNLVSIF